MLKHLVVILLAGLLAGGCDLLRGDPLCENPCTIGNGICTPEGELVTCQDPDASGCASWGPPGPCPPGLVCTAGECVCMTGCGIDDATCYDTVGTVGCTGPDENGCYYWGALEPGADGNMCDPDLNECIQTTPPDCPGVNDCDYEGRKICLENYPAKYRRCHYDDNGCLKWDCT